MLAARLEQALALSESAYFHANTLYDDGKRLESAKYYLMSAAHSYDFLFYSKDNFARSFVSPFGRYATQLYNASISRIINIRETEKAPWHLPWEVTVGNTKYQFAREQDMSNQITRTNFERYTPAYEIEAKSLNNLYSSRGIGAPMVGEGKNIPNTPEYNPFFTPVISSPLTVLFNFSPREMNAQTPGTPTVRQVTVSLLDPFKLDNVNIAGSDYPIEADYSSAFGVLIRDIKPGQFVLDALLNAANHVDRIKLVILEPYDPKKIPVLLVHGLYSSPATYIQMINDLMGVEAIRHKYQFWVFAYPTGLPVMESSTRLRRALIEISSKYNPDGKNENFNKMVVVGHSMGGILSRTLVMENSKPVWDEFFTVPIDRLNLDPDERSYLQELASFEALPFIRRAIFIASPLRGSEVAQSSFVTRLTRWLISLPAAMISRRYNMMAKNRQFLNPELNNDDFISVARTSVDNLRPDSPVLKGYMASPISPKVTYNSIIAIGESTVGLGSSDGLVKYESAHQDGAESEKLVNNGHVCLEDPNTIAEVRRILLSHVSQSAADVVTSANRGK